MSSSPVLSAAPSGFAAIPFRNNYVRLPERFYARVAPVPVRAPRLIKLNVELAEFLGMDAAALATPEGAALLAGNLVGQGSEPLAMAYAGHQFGNFVPQLGDGRANLLGEVVARDGKAYDVQLKGSGPTPFSRRGDGRAALGPVLREYLLSEAMAALGVPTTRALAAVATGEVVLREEALPGAVLTRIAASHVRVGTFQYFAARGDSEGLKLLAEYVSARHYPELSQAEKPVTALLAGVVGRHARLVAQWMLLGFVHGVMNTDNTSISGETIDYGPCAFLEAYDPQTVFSSIDQRGRYAYANQPHAALWNLTRLAECLLPMMNQEQGGEEAGLKAARAVLEGFQPQFEAARLAGLRAKLGLTVADAGDAPLAEDLLERMAGNDADFTLTFRRLADSVVGQNAGVRDLFAQPEAFDAWETGWRQRLASEPALPQERREAMRRVSPAFLPRNHRVQAVIDAATGNDDFRPFERLLDVLKRPFDDQPEHALYQAPARPEQRVTATFCGT